MIKDRIHDELEDAIDQIGLTNVLSYLAQICDEKAEHLRANWQDEITAKQWDKHAVKFMKLVITF